MSSGNAGKKAEGSLDHGLCEKMAELVEALTTSGRPSLDEGQMKHLKKICKNSDAHVEHCFQLIISQLGEEHAEIRLSAFQVINELFSRSHRFRELLVADMQEYLELTVETNVDLPLPPPKPAAKLLQEQALRAMQEWHNKFGRAYKKLGLGYTYLKNCKQVNFSDIQARSDAERRRAEERQRRVRLAQTQKLNQIDQEMNEIIPELQECLTQCENCFQLLLPNMAGAEEDNRAPSTSASEQDKRASSSPSSSSLSKRNRNESNETRKDIQEGSENGCRDTKGGKCMTSSDSSSTKKIKSSSKAKRKIAHDADKGSDSLGTSSGSTSTTISEGENPATTNTTPSKSIFDIDEDEPTAGSGSCDKEECMVAKSDEHGLKSGGIMSEKGFLLNKESAAGRDSHPRKPINKGGASTRDNKGTKEGDGEFGEEEPTVEDEEQEEEEENGKEERRGSVLQQHGLPSWTSINININVDADGIVIQEDSDNTDVLQTLEDQQRLLAFRYLSKIKTWLETLTKNSQSDKVKLLIDLKNEVKAQQDKYREMRVKWNLSPQKKTTLVAGKAGSSKSSHSPISSKRGSTQNDDDDDEDDDGGFDEVPDKEGYESDIPEELKEEYGLQVGPKKRKLAGRGEEKAGTSTEWHPIRSADMDLFDPASQAGSLAAMKEKLKKIREEVTLPPGFHTIPAKKVKKELSKEEQRRREHLERAPVLTFGTDLAYWENPDEIKAPVVFRPDTDARNWITAVDEEEVVLESAKDLLKTRVMSFTGTFKPVKWTCRAPLPNGALCERMDREKCPFHGKIIARDELGRPHENGQAQLGNGQQAGPSSSSSKKEETPAWRDPALLRDIEGATGVDLGSASVSTSSGGKGKGKGKKGKGKAKKYPGLTDIRKINNTSRNRLEKIVMNKSSLKRVAAAMTKVDQKKYRDKFGNNFNYAL